MTLEFVPGVTSITFGGQDITPMIDTGKPIVMHYVDPEEPFPSTYDMKPITLRLKGRATPQLYRMLLGRTHPRASPRPRNGTGEAIAARKAKSR